MGKKLCETNSYLKNPETRNRIVRQLVITSTEIEGVSRAVIEAGLDGQSNKRTIQPVSVNEPESSYSVKEQKQSK